MTETLTHVDQQPQWAKEFSSEIDTLEFGPGFDKLTETTKFSFGTTEMVGVTAVKAFFKKIDGGLETAHRTLDFWQGQTHHILKGEADLKKKGSAEKGITDPYMWIFYIDKSNPDKFERVFIVNGPIQTDNII